MQPTKDAAERRKTREEAVHVWVVRVAISAVGAIILGLVTNWIYDLIQKRQNESTPPLVGNWGLIEVTSTRCQAWVLNSRDDEHARMLEPQLFATSLGTLTMKEGEKPSLHLKPDDAEAVKECIGKFFQKLTDTEKVPRHHIFIVAGGFLSPDVLSDPGSARALLENAVKEATFGASLDNLKLKTELQLKFDYVIPSKDRYRAYLLDIGSDMVRVGWILQERGVDGELTEVFKYLFYPHLNRRPGDPLDKKTQECLTFDLADEASLIALTKTIYCVPSRQRAEEKAGGRLLPEDIATVDKEGGNSFWPRLCIAELRNKRK